MRVIAILLVLVCGGTVTSCARNGLGGYSWPSVR